MPNISKIIHNHNKNLIDKLLIDNQQTNKLLCNCRNKEDCTMRGMYNSKKVGCQATIFHWKNSCLVAHFLSEVKVYIGIPAEYGKQRFYNY